jgi:hypothetical protein
MSSYNGCVMSQFKKLEQDLCARGEPKWIYAMHPLCLLLSGIIAARDGELRLRMDRRGWKWLLIPILGSEP